MPKLKLTCPTCMVTSGHVTKRWQSHHSIRHIQKPHEPELWPLTVLHFRNRNFLPFLLLWPWPDDLHIQTWPIFPGDTADVQTWTSYSKTFKSYRLTDRQTDTIEIIYHAASQVVRNKPLYTHLHKYSII